MRILGIDPGSNATGFGVIERCDGRLIAVAHGVLRLPKGRVLNERLALLYAAILGVIEEHRPDQIAVEQVFVAVNPRSAIVLGQARGAVLAATAACGLAVSEYAPRAVKQSVVGVGNAAKNQVQAMVQRLLNLDVLPPTDAADALALAICHAQAGKLRALGVTANRRRSRSRTSTRFVVRRAR